MDICTSQTVYNLIRKLRWSLTYGLDLWSREQNEEPVRFTGATYLSVVQRGRFEGFRRG